MVMEGIVGVGVEEPTL